MINKIIELAKTHERVTNMFLNTNENDKYEQDCFLQQMKKLEAELSIAIKDYIKINNFDKTEFLEFLSEVRTLELQKIQYEKQIEKMENRLKNNWKKFLC